MKYKYKLNNLDCANCANKIECKLKGDSNIASASVNFSKLTVTLETNIKNGVKEYVAKIVKTIEPNINVLELTENMDKKNKTMFDISRLVICQRKITKNYQRIIKKKRCSTCCI